MLYAEHRMGNGMIYQRGGLLSKWLALALWVGTAPLTAQEVNQAPIGDPLQLTSEVTVGQLPNGLRYYLQPNSTPQDSIELRLVVRVGSVYEREEERGVAHFLEHMAFNGTERFPGNEIIAMLETLGISYGADLNAYTGFDQTVYTLQISTDQAGALETALDILAQWAAHISLENEEVEKERGVILEEWRRQQVAARRVFNTHLQALLANSRYAVRLPIGTEEVITNVTPETIRAFYRRWYRPGRMALIAVGNLKVPEMRAMITARFASLAAAPWRAGTPRVTPSHTELRASVAYDAGIERHSLTLYQRQFDTNGNRLADYRASIVQALFGVVLNNRLEERTANPASPLLQARVSLTPQRLTAHERVTLLRASFNAGDEQAAIKALVTELKRIESYGIPTAELQSSKTRLQRLYQSYWDGRTTRESSFFANAYIAHTIYDDLLLHPDQELALVMQLLPTIAPAELVAQAAQLLYGPNRLIALSGIPPEDATADIPTPQQVMGFFQQMVHQVPPRQSSATIGTQPLVDEEQFADPTIVEERYDAELEIHRWRLANGMQVLLKETDFERNQLLIDIYSKGGYVTVTENEYPAARVAVDIVEKSGLQEWSPTDLRQILANRDLALQPYLRQFSEGLSGRAAAPDIAALLQLVYLYFTAPGYNQDRASAHLRALRSELEFRSNNPRNVLADKLVALLYNNHPLVRTLTTAEVDAINLARAYAIYRQRFQNAQDFTALIVGDISPAALRPHLRYLAALPTGGAPEEWETSIQYVRSAGSVQEQLEQGADELALFRSLFWGEFEWSLDNNFQLRALAQALTNRLQERLREGRSLVYSVGSFGSAPRLPTDHYLLFIDFTTDPDTLPAAKAELALVLNSLRQQPLSAEELTRIQETERSNFRSNLRQNGFWLDLLRYADLYGYAPQAALQQEQRIDALTAEALQAAARRYMQAERYLELSVVPATAQ